MKLFVFGLGYTASHFVRQHRAAFSTIWGTVRAPEADAAEGATLLRFDGDAVDSRLPAALAASDALLVSVQPGSDDPVLARFGDTLAASPGLRRIVYLSTIGVYGDHDGARIDESAATSADNPRQAARIRAESDWLSLGDRSGKSVSVLRLAGIYGPSRNALVDLRAGEARRIDKPGQVFNRIHVGDIGHAILAAFTHAAPPRIVNVTDDEPAPAADVVAYAADLMGIVPPPLVAFAEAELSPMARSFYGANRRVGNGALRRDLGVVLAYPTYRSGLAALWGSGEGRSEAGPCEPLDPG